jgi:aspartokinase/homoserine dehydrogenase 1
VGSVLLEQIASQAPRLLRDFRLDLRVRALMTSKKMLLSDQPSASTVEAEAGRRAAGGSRAFEEHVHADHLPHAVIIDCSASDEGGRALPALARPRASTS